MKQYQDMQNTTDAIAQHSAMMAARITKEQQVGIF